MCYSLIGLDIFGWFKQNRLCIIDVRKYENLHHKPTVHFRYAIQCHLFGNTCFLEVDIIKQIYNVIIWLYVYYFIFIFDICKIDYDNIVKLITFTTNKIACSKTLAHDFCLEV